ncbi:hypothetical protein Dimus_017130 [Dionaea muscipula]
MASRDLVREAHSHWCETERKRCEDCDWRVLGSRLYRGGGVSSDELSMLVRWCGLDCIEFLMQYLKDSALWTLDDYQHLILKEKAGNCEEVVSAAAHGAHSQMLGSSSMSPVQAFKGLREDEVIQQQRIPKDLNSKQPETNASQLNLAHTKNLSMEPEKLAQSQKSWKPAEEPKIAAAIVELFHLNSSKCSWEIP